MKSNEELHFTSLFGVPHETSSEVSADGGGTLSLHVTIGLRGGQYRVYAYLFHNEQDASREHKQDESASRSDHPMEAARQWRVAALARGWDQHGVEAAYADLIDEIAEVTEDN